MPPREIVAAGAVVLRPTEAGEEVLLVHRPRYDDWAFPKGKADRGEHSVVAAVREVQEETGVRVVLRRPLAPHHYQVAKGPKVVHYWTARAVAGDVADRPADDEVDQVVWLPVAEAEHRLTYEPDVATLHEALGSERLAAPGDAALIVLRHGDARSRKSWSGDDRCRPLDSAGRHQAAALVPLLAAYDVRRVVSSTSTRCVETVRPLLDQTGAPGELLDVLSEEDAEPGAVAELVGTLVADLPRRGTTVVCSHRPVLPMVFDALGTADPRLAKGELAVVHRSAHGPPVLERHRPL